MIFLSIINICSFVAYLPQIVKLIKTRSGEDLSLMSWFLWLMTDVAWVCHSWFELRDLNQTLTCLLELILVLTIFLLTLFFSRSKERMNG